MSGVLLVASRERPETISEGIARYCNGMRNPVGKKAVFVISKPVWQRTRKPLKVVRY